MKILQVTPSFYPTLGGVAAYTLNLSQMLSQRGHQVDILTINKADAMKEEKLSDKIKVYRCSPNLRYRNLFVSFELAQKLRKANDYDLCHIHIPFPFILETAAATSLTNHIPLVATDHGEGTSGMPSIIYSVMAKLYNLYNWFARSVSLRYVDRIVFYSQSYAEYLRIPNKIRERVRIIRPGVDIQRFSPLNDDLKLRAQFGFSHSDKVVLFVGALDRSSRYKGVDYLLKAVHLARNENATIKLVIVGGGELVPMLKKLVAELELGQNVVFTGAMPNDHLPPYYAMCDIFVLPSIPGGPESFGLVVLEANASGKPAIASDLPGVRDAVKNEKTGLLVPPRDPEALAQAILRLIEDDDLRSQMAQNARKEVESHSWQRFAEEMEAVYSELVMFKEEQNAG